MPLRLLLDENLSEHLIRTIAPRYPDALHIRLLGMGGSSDLAVWERAISESCVLVTKDEDFVKLSVLRGPPPKVVWLNLGNVSNAVVTEALLARSADIERFVAHPELGFLALGPVIRPG